MCYNDPSSAYQAACSDAGPDHIIVVFGSFLIVGKILLLGSNCETNNG